MIKLILKVTLASSVSFVNIAASRFECSSGRVLSQQLQRGGNEKRVHCNYKRNGINLYRDEILRSLYLSGGPVSLRIVGFNLEVAEGGGVGGDASSSSSSSVPSASSSSFAAGAQPLSLGLIGPSSSTQSPSSPWRSVPGAEPSTPSSPETQITERMG